MEWQSIETAPKDGTRILVFTVHGQYEITEWFQSMTTDHEPIDEAAGIYRHKKRMYYEGWNGNAFEFWMPLPPAPSPTRGE